MNKLCIGILLGCAGGWGQTHTVTVRGIVKDSSGGVVRNAAVSATNVDQARHWDTRTGDAGGYVLVQIPPGNYSLSVAAPGFKKYERTGLVLQVAQTAELDVSLEVGAVGESIAVVAETPLAEPGSSFLGEVVNGSLAGALPLLTRDINQLVALTPGVSDSPNFRGPKFSSGNSSEFSANGGPGGTNEIILDGSPQTTMWSNQAGYVPQPEATQEFNVQTNSLAAEYGHSGGAVVNIVHRSGTREFHGKVYEYLRNQKLNANLFFDNRNGKDRAPFRGNDFGFVLGGPLTRARNSTFFFLNVQRILVAAPVSKTTTVPTVRMKNGDFGEVPRVYDPGTIDSTGARRLFPQNQIPVGLWNPAGVNLLKYYPDPTSPGISNNLFARATEHPSATDVSLKIDRRVSARQNLFGRFSMENFADEKPDYFRNAASPDAVTTNSRNGSVTVDDSYVRGSWILHGNYGYAHTSNTVPPAAPDFDPVSLGFPASMRSGLQVANVPAITVTGNSGLGPFNNPVGTAKYENHSLSGDAIRVAGRHTVKFGGTYRVNRASILQSNSPSGSFTFAEGFTTSAAGTSGSGGNAVASLLLGLPTAGGVGYEPALAIQVHYAALFVQDDWRVSSRLTLNLGLRWDSDRPLTERFDRTSWFDFNAILPVTAPGLGPVRGGLVFAGKNGAPRGSKDPDNNNFGPRAGLAYSVTPHFVLRSGFGIMYSPTLDNGPTSTNIGALGFNAFTDYVSSVDGNRHPFTTLSNPFPNGFNTPTGGRNGLLTFIGQTVNAQVRSDRTPYVAQWHFNTQYEWHKDMLLDIGYAGSAGVKLPTQGQLNQLPNQYLALGTGLNRLVVNPFFGIIPATSTLGAATVPVGQLLRPYPQFNKLIQTWGSFAHSSYHALQAKFRKRYRRGFQVLAAYTWSKMLDDSSGSFNGGNQGPMFMDNNRRYLDKSYSVFDIPHRLVASFEYELPFGAGRALLNSRGLVNAIAGGWRVSGIATYAAGAPISITQSGTNQTGSFDGNARPNRTGISITTPGSVEDRIDNYLNRAAFSVSPPYTFGNAGRFIPDARGPGRQNWDVALAKSFPIKDKFHVDFRAEAFNILNHANFLGPSPPATGFGLPGFGTIIKTDSARQMQLALSLNF